MIKKAVVKDIKKINDIGLTLYPNFKSIYNIENYLKNGNYIILVNEENEINAFLIIYKNIDFFELEVIIVAKENQHKGIATKLLNYFFNNYCHNKDEILLEVAEDNEKAINLYQKFGFKIINTRKKYYKDKDAYIMKKVIK